MNRSASVVAISHESPSGVMNLLRSAGIVVAGSALVAVCAHVSIPLWFTPVPITLQPFAVVLLGMLLGPQLAFATMVAYLVEGRLKMPKDARVFAIDDAAVTDGPLDPSVSGTQERTALPPAP